MIGEQFEVENEITGVILNIKPQFDAFQIWHKNGKDVNVREKIKSDLIKVLGLSSNIELDYAEFYPDKPAH